MGQSMVFGSLFMSRHQSSKGFTLIELLITSALSLVIVGGGIAAYNRFNNRQVEFQGGKAVIATLEQARERSSVGDKPAQGCTTLTGYRARGVVNTNSYFLSVICNGSLETEIKPYYLPEDMVFRSGYDVTFPTQPGAVATENVTVEVWRPNSPSAYRFIIFPSGTIQDVGVVEL